MTATEQARPQPVDAAASCFHCGLPVPNGAHYPVQFEARERATCCPGCQAVARTIVDNGLGSYYHHRTQPAGAPGEPLIPDELRSLALFDEPELQRQFVSESADKSSGRSLREASLMLEGITCAACVWLNERHVQALPEAVRQARWTLRIVRQNIAWAIGYNALALPVAATGLLTPWLAALGMSLCSLLVVGNALRLRGLLPFASAGAPK